MNRAVPSARDEASEALPVAVVEIDPARVQAALADIARRRTRPAMTMHEILDRLAAVVPTFVSRVRATSPGTS